MRRAQRLPAALAALILGGARAAPSVFVAYPPEGHRVAHERVILEGSVTPGASLTIDGQAVKVGPDGLFMEWWPLREGRNALRLVARQGAQMGGVQSGTLTLNVTRTVDRPLPATPTRIAAGSVEPKARLDFWDAAHDSPAERAVRVAFRGSVGGSATYRLAGSPPVPMREGPPGTYSATYTLPTGARFEAAALTVSLRGRDGRTVGATAPGRLTSSAAGPRLGVQRAGSVPGLGLNDAPNLVTTLDGQPLVYPRDGMAFSLVGRVGDDFRVRLAPGVGALVTAAQLEESVLSPQAASGGEVTLEGFASEPGVSEPAPPSDLRLRVPLGGDALPFRLDQSEDARALTVTLYGPLSAPLSVPPDLSGDPLLAGAEVRPLGLDVTALTLRLAAPAWGFHAGYDGGDLVLSVRRPPVLNPARPLEGRVITLDAGHGGTQKGGAGSLRVPEKDLVLPITLRAAQLLRELGASVTLTRSADVTLGLYERGLAAEAAGADLLVSVHANALPDGRDPRGVRGPEVYFTHPQAGGVAAEILRELRARLPELGPGAGLKPGAFLALTRPSTQISLLVELAYLTDPGNLRALHDPLAQEKFAQALAQGIAAFYAAQVKAAQLK